MLKRNEKLERDRMRIIIHTDRGEKEIEMGKRKTQVHVGAGGLGRTNPISTEEINLARKFIRDLMEGELKVIGLSPVLEDRKMPVEIVLKGRRENPLVINKLVDRFRRSSYNWKHIAEGYVNRYISNGAFIAAALYEKFEKYGDDIKVAIPRDPTYPNPNITFVSQKLKEQLRRLLKEYRKRG